MLEKIKESLKPNNYLKGFGNAIQKIEMEKLEDNYRAFISLPFNYAIDNNDELDFYLRYYRIITEEIFNKYIALVIDLYAKDNKRFVISNDDILLFQNEAMVIIEKILRRDELYGSYIFKTEEEFDESVTDLYPLGDKYVMLNLDYQVPVINNVLNDSHEMVITSIALIKNEDSTDVIYKTIKVIEAFFNHEHNVF